MARPNNDTTWPTHKAKARKRRRLAKITVRRTSTRTEKI